MSYSLARGSHGFPNTISAGSLATLTGRLFAAIDAPKRLEKVVDRAPRAVYVRAREATFQNPRLHQQALFSHEVHLASSRRSRRIALLLVWAHRRRREAESNLDHGRRPRL